MTSFQIILHGWKSSLRSASRGESLAGGMILSVVIGLVGLEFIGLGIFLPKILREAAPGKSPEVIVNEVLLYYVLSDLLLRFLLQRIPAQLLRPYLLLPVPRSTLIHLLLCRSLVSFFNVVPLLLLVPFAFTGIAPSHGVIAGMAWAGGFFLLMLSSSYLNFFLKKHLLEKPKIVLVAALAVVVCAGLDRFGIFSLAAISRSIFGMVLERPAIVILLIPLPILLYVVNYHNLRRYAYLDEIQGAKSQGGSLVAGTQFLTSMGKIGLLVSLDLRLLLRNKRSRASLSVALAAVAVGILYYSMLSKTEDDYYPQPDESFTLGRDTLNLYNSPESHMRRVTFKVEPVTIPSLAHVYIAGNHVTLGNWKPRLVPLHRNPVASWSRTFQFEEGTELQYRVTLGSWRTEELLPDGKVPSNYGLTVTRDTTIACYPAQWRVPGRDLMVEINLIYVGLMLSGLLMMVYGQFLLAWGSSFFDGVLTWKVTLSSIIQAKYATMILIGVISYVTTLPFAIFGLEILYVNSALFMYNIGVNSLVLIGLAAFHRKRLDLNEGVFSQQGKGASQFITLLPLYVLPIILYAPVKSTGIPGALYLFFGGVGVVGLLFHRPVLRWLTTLIVRRRYDIAAGFRQR